MAIAYNEFEFSIPIFWLCDIPRNMKCGDCLCFYIIYWKNTHIFENKSLFVQVACWEICEKKQLCYLFLCLSVQKYDDCIYYSFLSMMKENHHDKSIWNKFSHNN